LYDDEDTATSRLSGHGLRADVTTLGGERPDMKKAPLIVLLALGRRAVHRSSRPAPSRHRARSEDDGVNTTKGSSRTVRHSQDFGIAKGGLLVTAMSISPPSTRAYNPAE
jgi:hypothetical protein